MSKFHDDSSQATDPARVRLSRARLHKLFPRKTVLPLRRGSGTGSDQFEEILDEHLQMGDSRAAIVHSVEPLIIAAYTDELDCSVLLSFSGDLHHLHGPLRKWDRLLTVNTYFQDSRIARDLWNGPKSFHRFANFYPVIADFLSDDQSSIEARKQQIPEHEWLQCLSYGSEYGRRNPGRTRNGDPFYSHTPV